MNFRIILVLACCFFVFGCSGAKEIAKEGSTPVKAEENPLLAKFDTPFGVPPFDKIKDTDYTPAFEAAMESNKAEIAAITGNVEKPTFENTVEALEYSGRLLTQVSNVFFPMNSANTNEKLQAIAKEVAPKLSAHGDGILMNSTLFERVKAVYDTREALGNNAEQSRLLEETFKSFARGGALLNDEKKARLTEINQRLSVLGLTFGENLLAENNEFKLVIENKEELAGLPESVIARAKAVAEKASLGGKWVFTLHKPSWIPFLQFAQNRKHRETMFKGYIERGNLGDKKDNKDILVEMATLRTERANVLGYKTHAHYVLEESMAKSPDKVYELLNQLWEAALPVTKAEVKALQKMIKKDGQKFKLEAWDWWYYTEKLRLAEYDLSEDELSPYFELSNVQRGAFEIATKLFGLKFVEHNDIPTYLPEVKVVEVQEADGKHVGILYLDYFVRESKRQGAWMTAYRSQRARNGEFITPIIANVFNFSKAAGDKPQLLTIEEVETLFHEFGHALHGLLSNVNYPGLAGTNVSRDFVELPSQFMENWAVDPIVLKSYAKHYKTNEPIPDALIEKMVKSRHFNQGFMTTEYLAASFLDMNWHTFDKAPDDIDVVKFEAAAMDEQGLIPEIAPRYRSTYFAHIFAGGYSSGYYSYIWSAVLDSDAFAAFKEKEDLFDSETANKYREFILSKGNTYDPMELYIKFRGREPNIDPLLEKRGLK